MLIKTNKYLNKLPVIKVDKIKCPNCGKVQDAEVTQHLNAPFATYIKNCECGYIIMESEWDVIY